MQERDLLYPPGTRYYGYVPNNGGNAFYVETTSVPDTDTEDNYERNKDVVDRAVRTVQFE